MMIEQRGPFRVTAQKEVYRNPWITVREDAVIRPGGEPGIFGVVTMVPGATVLAIDDEGFAFLAREFKYGVGRESLEAVSGALQTDEPPLEGAKRELQEETGITAQEWIDLGAVDPFTTIINSPNHLFLAKGLSHGKTNQDHGETVSLAKVEFSRAVEMVQRGEITHAGSCVLILKAARHLMK